MGRNTYLQPNFSPLLSEGLEDYGAENTLRVGGHMVSSGGALEILGKGDGRTWTSRQRCRPRTMARHKNSSQKIRNDSSRIRTSSSLQEHENLGGANSWRTSASEGRNFTRKSLAERMKPPLRRGQQTSLRQKISHTAN